MEDAMTQEELQKEIESGKQIIINVPEAPQDYLNYIKILHKQIEDLQRENYELRKQFYANKL